MQLDAYIYIYPCMYAPDGLNEAVLREYSVGPQLSRHQLRRQELRRYEVRRYEATEVGCGT
jgi:hypothetical protein